MHRRAGTAQADLIEAHVDRWRRARVRPERLGLSARLLLARALRDLAEPAAPSVPTQPVAVPGQRPALRLVEDPPR